MNQGCAHVIPTGNRIIVSRRSEARVIHFLAKNFVKNFFLHLSVIDHLSSPDWPVVRVDHGVNKTRIVSPIFLTNAKFPFFFSYLYATIFHWSFYVILCNKSALSRGIQSWFESSVSEALYTNDSVVPVTNSACRIGAGSWNMQRMR